MHELAERLQGLRREQGTTLAGEPLPLLAGVACDKKFCIRAVNDTLDPFGGIDPATLPSGVTIEEENVSLGSRSRVVRSFLAFASQGPSARAKIESELIARFDSTLPRDHVLLFQRSVEGRVRSFIGGPGLINASHVADVTAEPDHFSPGHQVRLRLTDDGKARFGVATETMTLRRIAIVVGGEAKSVPVVMEKISGGMAFVSATDAREADALVQALSP